MPPLLILLITILLILPVNGALAINDLYVSTGTASATYTETTDSQSKELSGSEQSFSWRKQNVLSVVDLGVDVGKLTLSGDTSTHDVSFSSDYLNLIAGISFSLYPSWIDYAFDLGYRMSIDRMTIARTTSSGKIDNFQIGALGEESISRFAARAYFGKSLFLGLNVEQKKTLLQKSVQSIQPKLDAASSTTFSVGYRFGGKSSSKAATEGRKPMNQPGFGVCPPEWNAGC